MKIVFMGTPEFAVPTLKELIKKYEVVAVVSQPDKKKGRGKKLTLNPVKKVAIDYNIKNILQPINIKDELFIKTLKELEADLFVVIAYGQILSKEILNIPKYGCINVHGSILPKYRGAAPIQWAIINGEKETGITTMFMNEGLDSGDIILKKKINILEKENYGSLYNRMSLESVGILLNSIELIKSGKINLEKQDDKSATYAPLILKSMGKIEWNKKTEDIINLIRGLNPTPCAFTTYNDEFIKIYDAEEVDAKEVEEIDSNKKSGEIIKIIYNKGIVVKTKNSAILIKEIQKPGGKVMSVSDYLRGNIVRVGEFFI